MKNGGPYSNRMIIRHLIEFDLSLKSKSRIEQELMQDFYTRMGFTGSTVDPVTEYELG